MANKTDFNLDEMDAFHPVSSIKIGGREWPLYPVTIRDVRDSKLLEVIRLARETPDALDLTKADDQVNDLIEKLLWVLLRKGAPGMTPEKMIKREWTTTTDSLMELVPFVIEGTPAVWAVLSRLKLVGGDEAVNPLPASPLPDQQDGRAVSSRQRKSKRG